MRQTFGFRWVSIMPDPMYREDSPEYQFGESTIGDSIVRRNPLVWGIVQPPFFIELFNFGGKIIFVIFVIFLFFFAFFRKC
jgi:hypothetical protein